MMHGDTDVGAMLRQSAEDFMTGRPAARPRGSALGQPMALDRASWAAMAELGWLGLALPEDLNGADLGCAEAAVLCEVFGRTLCAAPYVAAALMPAVLLSHCAPNGASQSYAKDLAIGKQHFTLAWQESLDEVNPLPPATRLIDGRLHGRKRFVPAVEPDSILLVFVQTGTQVAIVAVDASAVGVGIESVATAQGSLSSITFAGAVLKDAVPLAVGASARAALDQALAVGRIAASAQLAGLARACLDKTVAYVTQRVQFGKPIGSFQSVTHRCVNLRIGVEMAEAAWQNAARLHTNGDAQASAAIYAAKARCGDVACEVGRVAIQLHGAMGFTEEVDIGQYLRTSMMYAALLGGATAMRRTFLTQQRAMQASQATGGLTHV